MIYFPLIAIPLIYFAVALLKPRIQPKLFFNLCAICVAVSLSWLILLLINDNSAEWRVSAGILMGMSITGLMYSLEKMYKKNKIKNFWLVRLIVIIGGFYGVYFLLHQQWSLLTLIVIGSVLLTAIVSLLFQGITHQQALGEIKGKKSIIQKLDDCC